MKDSSFGNVLTKHEQIIRYIKSLEINTKVSVRQIAKEMDVSEGTAYRAIKEAENQGLVSSIPKVGTIRIQAEEEMKITALNLEELSILVEGEVITGKERLGIVPAGYAIGCNSKEFHKTNLLKDSLLIVGDVPELQQMALEEEVHLLLTGTAKVLPEIIELARKKNVVIISCPYEAFEAISLLNRAIYNHLTNKELLRVEDIMERDVDYLTADARVEDWHNAALSTGHSRFPVVDQNMMVVGIVAAVDVAGVDRSSSLLTVMTKDVFTAERLNLVAHLSRVLVWEGFELVPVVEEGKLIGVVSRQDILKAFQQTQKQPHLGETVDNLVMSGFKLDEWEDDGTKISGEITQFMINEYGAASPGVLVAVISTAAYIAARRKLRVETVLENMSFYHMEPLAVGQKVEVYTRIVRAEKKSCVADTMCFCGDNLKVKAVISLRIIKK